MKAKTKRRLKHLVGKKKLFKRSQAKRLGRSVFVGVVGACTASLAYAVSVTHPTVALSVRSPIDHQTIAAPVITVAATPADPGSAAPDQVGRGSWYALGLYSPDALTCASRTFPRGSHLYVTNTQNGRSVTCLVNDYGPAIWTGRVIDLSRGSFSSVANLGQGTIPVQIRLVGGSTSYRVPKIQYLSTIGYELCSEKMSADYCDAHRTDSSF